MVVPVAGKNCVKIVVKARHAGAFGLGPGNKCRRNKCKRAAPGAARAIPVRPDQQE